MRRSEAKREETALVSGVGAGSAGAEASVGEAGLAFGLLDLALDDLALVVGHLQCRRGDLRVSFCATMQRQQIQGEKKPTLPTATSILPEKVTKNAETWSASRDSGCLTPYV